MAAKRKSKKPKEPTWKRRLLRPFRFIRAKTLGLMARRPHRSFRLTRRRDYARSLKLPGYFAFTAYVWKNLTSHKGTFIGLALVGIVLTGLLVGIASQDTYTQLAQTVKDTGGEIFQGNLGNVGQAVLLLAAGVMGTYNASPTDAQRIFSALIGILLWLTTVWLLRSFMAGQKPRLRDGLYNAGAPIVSTTLVVLLLVVQLLPMALAALGFSAATASGLLDGGVEAMVFWVVVTLLVTLSVYWLSTTFIALVVVTLPGMYPWRAVRTASDLVIGRRVRILLRMFWMILTIVVGWVVVMVPIILLDTWFKSVVPAASWLPTVPVVLLIMGSLTIIWASSYIYLLYRKVVDDDAKPA